MKPTHAWWAGVDAARRFGAAVVRPVYPDWLIGAGVDAIHAVVERTRTVAVKAGIVHGRASCAHRAAKAGEYQDALLWMFGVLPPLPPRVGVPRRPLLDHALQWVRTHPDVRNRLAGEVVAILHDVQVYRAGRFADHVLATFPEVSEVFVYAPTLSPLAVMSRLTLPSLDWTRWAQELSVWGATSLGHQNLVTPTTEGSEPFYIGPSILDGFVVARVRKT